MKHIVFCQECATYTMKEEHCKKKTVSVKPPKYSPDDKYAKYRRKAKEEDFKARGLI